MTYLAFNSRTIGTIINKFPDGQILKLNKQEGTGKERLENVLMKITEFRGEAQALEKPKSMLASTASNKPKKRYETGQGSGPGGNNPVSAQINYSLPRREPNCRVCYHLKEADMSRPA